MVCDLYSNLTGRFCQVLLYGFKLVCSIAGAGALIASMAGNDDVRSGLCDHPLSSLRSRFMLQLSYYDILGVTGNASLDEIKKAYRKLALKWHRMFSHDQHN